MLNCNSRVLVINDYALHTIEESVSKGFPCILPWHSSSAANEAITVTFSEITNFLSRMLRRLILEAEVSLANLNRLEERLSTLHELVLREDSSISSAKVEILSELWTKLGGDQHMLCGFDDHFVLLRRLGGYRKRALAHIVAVLQTLQAMSVDMEDLRGRAAALKLISGRIPVESHIRSLRSGLERLLEGRLKARHMEAETVRKVLMGELH
jgi:hypothetical protein